MRTRLWHAALLVCLGAPIVQAQQRNSAPAIARPAAASTYRISGKVVDAHTGAALARCSVQIADVKERSESRNVTSSDAGAFSFDGLPVGKYRLVAQRRGYMALAYEQHGEYSTAIAVGPGLASTDLIFKFLTAEGVIAGTVTDGSQGSRCAQAQGAPLSKMRTPAAHSHDSQQPANGDDR